MPTRPEDPTIHPSVTASATPEEIADRILAAYAERSAPPPSVADVERLLARVDELARDLPELWRDTPLTVDQAGRAHVVESLPFPITSVQDVLDVAEWIHTGVRPLPIELLEDYPEACVLPAPEVTAEPVRVDPFPEIVDPAEVRGYGTYVLATFEGQRVRAMFADPGNRKPWMVAGRDDSLGAGYAWVDDGDLFDVVLLDAGEMDPFQ